MIQGTASNVGKSLLVTALCRYFSDSGLVVAPFKSQNMSNNAAVTVDGLEIGRAQAVQALAARRRPSVDMNPILLKPEADQVSQVLLSGRPFQRSSAMDYAKLRPQLAEAVAESYARLARQVDLVIIEGAGSPAEVNLRDRDLVNMHVAELADAPVLLVSDIDRGGVFASLLGTLMLLRPKERRRVAGLIVNKFRGDPRLFEPGVRFLEAESGLPVLGVLPYWPNHGIPEEDALGLEDRLAGHGRVEVAVIRYPHIANFDDCLPLEREPEISLRFVERPDDIGNPALLILPGTKATVSDLAWLREQGFEAPIRARAASGGLILGICGGCQMLGRQIRDPEGVESRVDTSEGLGLLPLSTHFVRSKRSCPVSVQPIRSSALAAETDAALQGYVIHQGQTQSERPLFRFCGQGESWEDGAASGSVFGTMLHGLFENASLRGRVLSAMGATAQDTSEDPLEAALDRLAKQLSEHLDMPKLWSILDLPAPSRD